MSKRVKHCDRKLSSRRLIDMLEIGLCAINLGIMSKELDIVLEDWISWKNRHAIKMSDMSKELVIY